MCVCVSDSSRLYDDFILLLFFLAHRETTTMVRELPEDSVFFLAHRETTTMVRELPEDSGLRVSILVNLPLYKSMDSKTKQSAEICRR